MYTKVTFIILLSRFPYKSSSSSVCSPNSQSLLNGKICNCNGTGQWIETDCIAIERHQICRPGQVVFQGCSRCVCQESGQMSCTEESNCSGRQQYQNIHETLTSVLPWCNPFRTYYINCNVCICPASGKTSESRCALDISCTFFKEPTDAEMFSKKNICIPKVLYLFPCLHCLCSDDGFFDLDKCVETCVRKQVETTRRCIPRTIYRRDCNVCLCPENSIPDNKYCTNATCNHPTTFGFLRTLKTKQLKCTPYEFLKPRCIYCDCNHDGGIDEKTCLELSCLKSEYIKYDVDRESCSPGEMVSFCMECLCPHNGVTSDEYCTKACSYQSKLKLLETILHGPKNKFLLDHDAIKHDIGSDSCEPNTIYIDQGRYCLCPETGDSNFNLCTSSDSDLVKNNNFTEESHIAIDFNATCEPSTFVEFECNTCFCSKNGKIDPKWCTYDDCESKRIIQDSHSIYPPTEQISNICNPGSISMVDCNFCICSINGLMEDRVCTKNDCTTQKSFVKSLNEDNKFACDPLAYYEVDCNICYCPRDGIKNVAKCTKNHCEKSFLRSNTCSPGQLFSDECNVCVCPPNGNKADKACTNYSCADTAPWKKIFQLSETLLGNQITQDATRNLDLCFPGEEFISGCNLCVCPDMGLRLYGTCSPTFCEEELRHSEANQELNGSNRDVNLYRKLDTRREDCTILNFTDSWSRDSCTPGSMYIIRCKQCICPYMGDISHFCRPLPKDFHCEQPYPGFNYMPMGRRTDEDNTTQTDSNNRSTILPKQVTVGDTPITTNMTLQTPVLVVHEHTRFECSRRGNIVDECFLCQCDGETLIAEHCFQSNMTSCAEATPTFLQGYDKPKLEEH